MGDNVETIAVPWVRHLPPTVVEQWHDISQVDGATFGDLDGRYDLPLGTCAALNHAFSLGLPRATGWELLEASSFEAGFRQAALIYKRGVGFRCRQEDGGLCEKGVYPINIRNNFQHDLLSDHPAFYVLDSEVVEAWPDLQQLAPSYVYHASEATKNLQFVTQIRKEWRRCGRYRKWCVIGGGITSDVAGFAASLEGCQTVIFPTTLLAMVDASVGGKVGVNFHPYGKNQVGSFHFPEAVEVCLEWLGTLPERHALAGLSEALKHAMLVGDNGLLQQLVEVGKNRRFGGMHKLLLKVINVKAAVVQSDPMEQGPRKMLNLGHTLAHALEAYSQNACSDRGDLVLSHGEAVAIGLLFCIRAAENLGYLDPICAALWAAGLRDSGCLVGSERLAQSTKSQSTTLENLWPSLVALMRHDKKATGRQSAGTPKIPMVLPLGDNMLGRPEAEWFIEVDAEVLRISYVSVLNEIAS